jgi:hypothetical protein
LPQLSTPVFVQVPVSSVLPGAALVQVPIAPQI